MKKKYGDDFICLFSYKIQKNQLGNKRKYIDIVFFKIFKNKMLL
jgi:hypothetical protein